jgi:YbbR domain-containing protein
MTFLDMKINWQILLISFVLACGLWHTVTVRDRLEVQAEVTLNYRGMPEHLMVLDGMLKSFTVQVRGPRELVKSLDTKMLTYAVDLAHLRRGTNVIALDAPRAIVESRALDVMGLAPNRLVLEAEDVLESSVPLEARFSAPALAHALKAENLKVVPASISLRGPESVIRKMHSLRLDVPLEPTATGDYRLPLSVGTPPQVTAAPGTVLVSYSVAGKSVVVELERTPFLDAKHAPLYRITPRKVALTVELPEGLRNDKSYLEKVRVVMDAQALPPSGSAEVRPSVELPEWARLVGISPVKLDVTKSGK